MRIHEQGGFVLCGSGEVKKIHQDQIHALAIAGTGTFQYRYIFETCLKPIWTTQH